MSPKTLRILGIICFVAALALAVLNLKRVANLGTNGLVVVLMLIGMVLMANARKASR